MPPPICLRSGGCECGQMELEPRLQIRMEETQDEALSDVHLQP